MIPTREQIDDHYSVNALAWLRAMRDEIDRLQGDNENLSSTVDGLTEENRMLAACKEVRVHVGDVVRVLDGDEVVEVIWGKKLVERAEKAEAELSALREDLEVYPDGIWTTREMVAKIGLLLAQPAPSNVYSRGRTIAESAEPPTAYYPPAPVEIWPEEMKRQTLVGKFEPAPVEQPAAAVPDHVPDAGKMVPDDTRELVAQLAEFVAITLKGEVNRDEVQAIAKQLRGGA